MYDFTYQRASSQDEAISNHKNADDARYLAGGMTLIPVLKQRLDKPSDLIDLGDLEGLQGIAEDNGNIVIKAMTNHHTVNSVSYTHLTLPTILLV